MMKAISWCENVSPGWEAHFCNCIFSAMRLSTVWAINGHSTWEKEWKFTITFLCRVSGNRSAQRVTFFFKACLITLYVFEWSKFLKISTSSNLPLEFKAAWWLVDIIELKSLFFFVFFWYIIMVFIFLRKAIPTCKSDHSCRSVIIFIMQFKIGCVCGCVGVWGEGKTANSNEQEIKTLFSSELTWQFDKRLFGN